MLPGLPGPSVRPPVRCRTLCIRCSSSGGSSGVCEVASDCARGRVSRRPRSRRLSSPRPLTARPVVRFVKPSRFASEPSAASPAGTGDLMSTCSRSQVCDSAQVWPVRGALLLGGLKAKFRAKVVGMGLPRGSLPGSVTSCVTSVTWGTGGPQVRLWTGRRSTNKMVFKLDV